MADIIMFFKSMYTTKFSSNVSDLVTSYIPNPRFRSYQKGVVLKPKLLRAGAYRDCYFMGRVASSISCESLFEFFVEQLDDVYNNK